MESKPKLLPQRYFTAHIGQNPSWNVYRGAYQGAVEHLWRDVEEGRASPDAVALPLLFLVRYALELGYKWNLAEFYSALERGNVNPVHDLTGLHVELGNVFEELVSIGWVSNEETKEEFRKRYAAASEFKDWLQELDKWNDAFRYPYKNPRCNPEMTPHFDFSKQVDLFTDVMEPYQQARIFLNCTLDVVGLDEFKNHRLTAGDR